ncbi:MAG TPA: MnhB domain-containing protein [Tepidisphaeraceae bacterium]|jgi:multicomponent Na+:H+ antiporter subunit B
MKYPFRMIAFFIGAAGFAAVLATLFIKLPVDTRPTLVGDAANPNSVPLHDRYLQAINANVMVQRNVTDAVTAVNFDYRGFDTVGEEFIFFVSVMGGIVLLKQAEEKRKKPLRDAISAGRDVGPSDAMRVWVLGMVAPKICFGIYIVTHGQLSPGGGFQGGVILATAALIIYLGENFEMFKNIMSHPLVEVVEAIGAGGFVLTGVLAYFWTKPYLTDVLPLGKTNELTSGGTIAIISFLTGIEIMAGFVLILFAFLQETLVAGE